ncbi:unnamed protein product [Lampetra planeri]
MNAWGTRRVSSSKPSAGMGVDAEEGVVFGADVDTVMVDVASVLGLALVLAVALPPAVVLFCSGQLITSPS